MYSVANTEMYVHVLCQIHSQYLGALVYVKLSKKTYKPMHSARSHYTVTIKHVEKSLISLRICIYLVLYYLHMDISNLFSRESYLFL